MGAPEVQIFAAELATGLAGNAEDHWTALLGGDTAIRPLERVAAGQSPGFGAEISPEIAAALGAEVAPGAPGWAFSLALAVGRRTLAAAAESEAGGKGLALILATTKAEVGELALLSADPAAAVTGCWKPGRMAEKLALALGCDGPVMAVSNACASGLLGIIHGSRLIRRGAARRALIIGADVLHPFVYKGFASLGALSPEACRPYDRSRLGLNLGEGAGALLLGSGARKENILGIVEGWGVSNDAHHITAPSRSGAGLQRALRQAIRSAGRRPEDYPWINGHGTGTRYNDAMELVALAEVFRDAPAPTVCSLKGAFGHCLGAAGVIEAALCLAILRGGQLPASLGFEAADEDAPKTVNIPREPCQRSDVKRMLTLKSGFGGISAALALALSGAP